MIQSLTEHIWEIDDRIGALEAEAMQLQPMSLLCSRVWTAFALTAYSLSYIISSLGSDGNPCALVVC